MNYLHPSAEQLRSIDVHEILPQQEPFVMIDSIVAFDGVRTATETVIKEDNIFTENGRFSEAGLVENIAQTCAARIGYANKFIYQKNVQIGVIGAVRNLKIIALPKVGEKITTSIQIVEEVFGMTLVSAEVKDDTRTLVTAEMKIAVRNGE